jgi:micrococcal nuclease
MARTLSAPAPEPELVGAVTTPLAESASSPDTAVLVGANGERPWVEPLEGGVCPATHPVKANDTSHIFHVPGGRFYERTEAVRCYATPEDAATDGYRQAKA